MDQLDERFRRGDVDGIPQELHQILVRLRHLVRPRVSGAWDERDAAVDARVYSYK
jgi:hypothetical protein